MVALLASFSSEIAVFRIVFVPPSYLFFEVLGEEEQPSTKRADVDRKIVNMADFMGGTPLLAFRKAKRMPTPQKLPTY